jgi:LacI family transcriptional regulator
MSKRTIIEIAKRVGVSPASVSRALNNVPGVSPDKRRQILAVAEELNYHPNVIARSLQGQRTNTLAYIYVANMPDRAATDQFFFKNFITVLAERCASYGMDLLLHPATDGDGSMNNIGRVLRSGRADGLILADIRRVDQRVLYLLEHQLPFIAFGRTDIRKPYPYVDVDGEWGIYTATCHVFGRGHRRIGFLGLLPEFTCAVDRYDGYCRALRERGLSIDQALIAHGLTNETETRVAVERLLALPEPPTAFVAASDMLAIYTMGIAAQRGMIAGHDYAITGYDDLPLAAHTNPPLTTIRQPLHQMCEELIGLLMRRLDGEERAEHTMLRPELVIRASS